jgi:hypothetical protein
LAELADTMKITVGTASAAVSPPKIHTVGGTGRSFSVGATGPDGPPTGPTGTSGAFWKSSWRSSRPPFSTSACQLRSGKPSTEAVNV